MKVFNVGFEMKNDAYVREEELNTNKEYATGFDNDNNFYLKNGDLYYVVNAEKRIYLSRKPAIKYLLNIIDYNIDYLKTKIKELNTDLEHMESEKTIYDKLYEIELNEDSNAKTK